MTRAGLLCVIALAACAPVSGGTGAPAGGAAAAGPVWPVLTRSHVDLWLHGYAMLLRDTAAVPVFRRGYREQVEAERRRRGVSTLLDANRDRLQDRLAVSSTLAGGQFAPFYFGTFDQMRDVISRFVEAGGDIRAASDRTMAQYFAVLAQSFPTAADRDWLRLFTNAMEDERRQFYQQYWTEQQASRIALVRAADSLWQATYRGRFQRYLNNTQQEDGELILALTLGGEGRTVNFSARQNAIASTMPESDAREAIYVFAHEAVIAIVTTAVNDNITPVEQRAGAGARYVSSGAVRAAAMLLQRIAPELVDGFTRYYLTQAGESATGDIAARLASTFPLPEEIRAAIDRQLGVVLGGI